MTSPNTIFIDPLISHGFDSILDFLGSADAPTANHPVLVCHDSRDCPDSPPEYILFNTEQLTREVPLSLIVAASAAPSCKEVWDYSDANVRILARHGVVARHVPIRSSQEYMARLRRSSKAIGATLGWTSACRS